jgi:integrase
VAKNFVRLTRAAARKLAPNESINEHGITLTRLANGDGLYTVNVMVDGQRIHRTIGRESDGTTRTQAEEFIAQARTDAKHDRLALPKGRKVSLSFRDAAGDYLRKLEAEGGKNLQDKRSRLELHLVPFFGDTPLSKLTSFDVRRYKKQRLSEPSGRGGDRRSKKAPRLQQAPAESRPPAGATQSLPTKMTAEGSVNRELAVLSQLFNKAVEWGWITRRPAKIERFKETGRIVFLTVDQSKRLIAAAATDTSPIIYPFIAIGLSTSMRLTEILTIRREHVDVGRRVIFIPKAKAGMREQPITAQLADFLERYVATLPADNPWLFPSSRSECGHIVDVKYSFERVVLAAGLDPKQVIRHTLRHTAITHLVQAGVDLPTIKKISGHKTLAMIDRYSHADGEHIQFAMDRLESRLQLPKLVAITQELHRAPDAESGDAPETRLDAGGPPGGRTRHQRIMSPLL